MAGLRESAAGFVRRAASWRRIARTDARASESRFKSAARAVASTYWRLRAAVVTGTRGSIFTTSGTVTLVAPAVSVTKYRPGGTSGPRGSKGVLCATAEIG